LRYYEGAQQLRAGDAGLRLFIKPCSGVRRAGRRAFASMSAAAVIVFVALLGFGAWLLYGARDLIRLGFASYKWSKAEGTIIDSRDASFTISGVGGTSGESCSVPVKYQETVHDYVYEVAGQMYRCSTYCFGGSAENATAAYAIGTKVTVHYDPKHPEIAVLRRGVQFGAVFGLVPIGAAFLWLFLSLRD
jgi:hypothetical protein